MLEEIISIIGLLVSLGILGYTIINFKRLNDDAGVYIDSGSKEGIKQDNIHLEVKTIQSEYMDLQSYNFVEQAKSIDNSISSIKDTISLIKNIAEQTNILALDAALQAARAGEAGRGFTVVADEVRNIAEKASASTSEINTLIDNLSNSSKNLVVNIENEKNYINNATDDMDETLGVVTESIKELEEVASSIVSTSSAKYSDIERLIYRLGTGDYKLTTSLEEISNKNRMLKKSVGT